MGNLISRMLKTVAVIVCTALFITTAHASGFAAANSLSAMGSGSAAFDAGVHKLERHVTRSKDGTFVLNVSPKTARQLAGDAETLKAIQSGMALINEQIKAGTLASSQDLKVFVPGQKASPTDGASVETVSRNSVAFFWWGFRLSLTNDTVHVIMLALAGGATAATIAALIATAPGITVPIAALLGIAAALLGLGIAVLNYCNRNGSGVIISQSIRTTCGPG